MLTIYFALADNLRQIRRIADGQSKNTLVVNIRSDSKTTAEQLQGISEIRDCLMQRIYAAIRKILERMAYRTVFNHLERERNVARLLLVKQRRRMRDERRISDDQEKVYATGQLAL